MWSACLDPSRAFGSARGTTSTLPLLRQICSLGIFPIHLDLGACLDLVRDVDMSQVANSSPVLSRLQQRSCPVTLLSSI